MVDIEQRSATCTEVIPLLLLFHKIVSLIIIVITCSFDLDWVSFSGTKRPKDITNDDVYFTVFAGEPLPANLTRACRDGVELDIPRFLCFTSNPNVTFEQSLNLSECAICVVDTDLRGCHPFGNNDHFLVRATTETCPSILNLSIQSKENTTVDFSDSGRIFCAYQYNVYTTVHIRVIAKPPPNLLSLEIAAPASAAVLLMIVTLLVVISALGYKHRALLRARSGRSRQRQRAEQRLLVAGKCIQYLLALAVSTVVPCSSIV